MGLFKSCHSDKQMPDFDGVRFFCLFEYYDNAILYLCFPSTSHFRLWTT